MTKKLCIVFIMIFASLIISDQAYANNQRQEILDNIYSNARDAMDSGAYVKSAASLYDYIVAAPKGDTRLPEVYFQLGNIYRYAGKYDDARKYFWKIISDFPDSNMNMKAQFYVARTYDEEGEYFKAVEYYNNITASDILKDNQKRMATDQMRSIMKHRADFRLKEKAADELPPSTGLADVYIETGEYYLTRGKYSRALEIFKKMEMADSSGKAEHYIEMARLKGRFPGAKIGVMLPLTGKYSKVGNELYHSISTIHEINNRQLEKGRKAVMIKADTMSELEIIPVIYEKLVKKGADVVIGPIQSKASELLKPYVEKYKVPVVFLVASDDDITEKSKYFFRNSIRHQDEAKLLADYGVRELRLTNFAVLVPDDNRGLEGGKRFKKRIETYNAVLPVFSTYKKGDTTYTEQLKLAQNAFVEGLFVLGTNQKDLQQLIPSIPYVGLNVSVLADSSLFDEFLFRVLGENLNGIIIATYYNREDFGIREKDIYDSYMSRYNHSLDQISALGIDAYNIAFEGIKRSAGIAGEKLAQSMLSISSYNGLCGNVSVSGSGDMVKEIFLYRMEKGGPRLLRFNSDGEDIVAL